MVKINFGLMIPGHRADQLGRGDFVSNVNLALEAASGHFDSAWMIDHLETLESFTTLSYLTGIHPSFKFGHSVICQSFRSPALVARMAATLQFLSGGRYILGIGTGWNEEEYKANGYDFPPAGVRVSQLEEALQIIQAMWREPQATFHGKYYRIEGARCEPRPDPLPPILVGAFKPRMLRLAARCADDWNVSSTAIEKYRRLAEEFNLACQSIGRDPLSVGRSWGAGCAIASSQMEAERLAAERFTAGGEENFDLVGSPAQLVAQMQPFIELGVGTFILDFADFPNLNGLRLFIEEVIPALHP